MVALATGGQSAGQAYAGITNGNRWDWVFKFDNFLNDRVL